MPGATPSKPWQLGPGPARALAGCPARTHPAAAAQPLPGPARGAHGQSYPLLSHARACLGRPRPGPCPDRLSLTACRPAASAPARARPGRPACRWLQPCQRHPGSATPGALLPPSLSAPERCAAAGLSGSCPACSGVMRPGANKAPHMAMQLWSCMILVVRCLVCRVSSLGRVAWPRSRRPVSSRTGRTARQAQPSSQTGDSGCSAPNAPALQQPARHLRFQRQGAPGCAHNAEADACSSGPRMQACWASNTDARPTLQPGSKALCALQAGACACQPSAGRSRALARPRACRPLSYPNPSLQPPGMPCAGAVPSATGHEGRSGPDADAAAHSGSGLGHSGSAASAAAAVAQHSPGAAAAAAAEAEAAAAAAAAQVRRPGARARDECAAGAQGAADACDGRWASTAVQPAAAQDTSAPAAGRV